MRLDGPAVIGGCWTGLKFRGIGSRPVIGRAARLPDGNRVDEPLPGYPANRTPLSQEQGACQQPMRYGFRSFNRQWIIPDARLITQPNAELWRSLGNKQVFLFGRQEQTINQTDRSTAQVTSNLTGGTNRCKADGSQRNV